MGRNKIILDFGGVLNHMLVSKIKVAVEIQASSDDVEQYFMVIQFIIGRDVFEGEHYKIHKE